VPLGSAAAVSPALDGLKWRLVGPAHMSGRVTDIAVPRNDKRIAYCATATGGLWKTVNQGTTWTPIFDDQGSSSIGAVAVSESHPDTVWVGTGEANASSYTSWGDGVYRSSDGGRSWTHAGLADSHHIGRIAIHPRDPETVYVAALGRLWGSNEERGLFKTTDGGRSWEKSLALGPDVGVVDVSLDPVDPRIVYAAAYARRADRFDDFDSVGIYVLPGGGLYKSNDAGQSWSQLTMGLPSERVGRIGLAVAPGRPGTVYAVVEVAPEWIHLEDADRERALDILGGERPADPAEVFRLRAAVERLTPPGRAAIVAGLSRAQQAQLRALLGLPELDTGGGVFRSDDRGETWRRVSPINEREGYYSQIRVDPNDPEHVYLLMVRTWESLDGGKRFEQTDWAVSSWLTSNFIHGDFHAMWIDPDDSRHLLVGSDGGLYRSYDRGASFEAHPLPIGQFVGIAVDFRRPYHLYGGLQDNGVWTGPSATRHASGVTDADWAKIMTADGAYVQVDPTDADRVYTSSQYGNVQRLDLRTGARRSIRPRRRSGEPRLRFNYTAPFILSPHDPSTLFMGAQRLFRSSDRGESWVSVSPDLTQGRPNPDTGEGATITTIAESPRQPGILWVGTDDGNLQVTKDGGKTWRNVSEAVPNLPRDREGRPRSWVSRVEASPFDPAIAYLSFDAHRDDDFGVYLYRTNDYGESWTSISANLPSGAPVNVVRADPLNPDLLFVGTERAAHASVDGGRQWIRLGNGLPTVPVEDLLIHPRDRELVAGTHGCGFYILDILPLQELTPEVLRSDLHLFATKPAILWNVDLRRNKGASGARRFAAPNPYGELTPEGDASGMAPPGATLYYYLKEGRADGARLTLSDAQGNIVRELAGPADAGVNRVLWDLRKAPLPPGPSWRQVGGNDSRRLARVGPRERPGPLVEPAEYQIALTVGGIERRGRLRVEPDPQH
jgi:photosystem II stability/assembly factor-like uncharacterized protein